MILRIALLVVALGIGVARAEPSGLRVGDVAKSLDLPDVHGRRYTLASFKDKRILEFWYEGKQSQHQNARLKDRIRELRAAGRITNRHYESVGIANYMETAVPNVLIDLALKQILRKEPYLVLCDRDGRMQRLWGFRNGRSNVYLFDEARRLVWKSSGPLPERRAGQLIRLIMRLTRERPRRPG